MKCAIGRINEELTIIDVSHKKTAAGNVMTRYKVRCACGEEHWMSAGNWGKSKMCTGCRKKKSSEASSTRSRHPLFGIWVGMLARCRDPKHASYRNYGGRGISVCSRWTEGVTNICSGGQKGFDAFVADMGGRPAGGSIDRVDNSKGYSPDNCRWATPREQSRNTRVNVVFDGITKAEWAEKLGVSYGQLSVGIRITGSLSAAVAKVLALPEARRTHILWVEKRKPRTKPAAYKRRATYLEKLKELDEELGKILGPQKVPVNSLNTLDNKTN